MFPSTLTIALAGFMASTAMQSPSWRMGYDSAQRLGMEQSKPLAVFIGSGEAGWNQVTREGELAKEVRRLLAKNYVYVYIDTEHPQGKQLASYFEVSGTIGLIVSDHTGKYQAFHHQGDLPNEQLLNYLIRYADSERIVRATETYRPEAANYSSPEIDPAAVQPYYQPSFRGVGRSC
jgi:hypothetical protein